MTIQELAQEYSRSATLLRGRIVELERAMEAESDEEVRHQLDGRLRPLRSMYRDTRMVAHYLERYDPRKRKGSQ